MKTWHFLTRGGGGLPNIWRQKIVIFYAEILTKKVVLGCFFTSETSEIIQNSNFQMGWKSNQVITPTFPKNLEAFTCYEQGFVLLNFYCNRNAIIAIFDHYCYCYCNSSEHYCQCLDHNLRKKIYSAYSLWSQYISANILS